MPYLNIKGNWVKITKKQLAFDKRGMHFKTSQSRTYVPSSTVHVGKWFRPTISTNNDQLKLRLVELGVNSSYQVNSLVSKKYSYTSTNNLGNKSMTNTYLGRHQRKKKDAFGFASKGNKS